MDGDHFGERADEHLAKLDIARRSVDPSVPVVGSNAMKRDVGG